MDIIRFFQEALRLKNTKRTGWELSKVPEPESVADHSWGTAVLAAVIPLPEDVDRDRLVRMALLHDIGEGAIGDIVWERDGKQHHDIGKKKDEQEKAAIKILFNMIGDDDSITLVTDYIEQRTAEARFLKQLDKLEMVFQAYAYDDKTDPRILDQFWESSDKYLTDKNCREIYEKLKSMRNS